VYWLLPVAGEGTCWLPVWAPVVAWPFKFPPGSLLAAIAVAAPVANKPARLKRRKVLCINRSCSL
jgi:hypothetical protein